MLNGLKDFDEGNPEERSRDKKTRYSFEAVAAREEDSVRMVVSRGSKHALTVLWMGRWFSDSLISVPTHPPLYPLSPSPGDGTRWRNNLLRKGEFLRGTRGSVHRESSSKLHPSPWNPSCQEVCFFRVFLEASEQLQG